MKYTELHKMTMPEVYVELIEDELRAGNIREAFMLLDVLGLSHADSVYFNQKKNIGKLDILFTRYYIRTCSSLIGRHFRLFRMLIPLITFWRRLKKAKILRDQTPDKIDKTHLDFRRPKEPLAEMSGGYMPGFGKPKKSDKKDDDLEDEES